MVSFSKKKKQSQKEKKNPMHDSYAIISFRK